MLETIYTIPVNEAFDASVSDDIKRCPFCRLYEKLQDNELDLILGASMMDPDIRIKTNEYGFCRRHYDKMFVWKNRLGLGLILESHLNEVKKNCSGVVRDALLGAGSSANKQITKLEGTCYICGRIEHSLSKMIENAALLWNADEAFKKKLADQPFICLPHFRRFTETGKDLLPKKEFADFYKAAYAVTFDYFDSLCQDISWFCKKFDYRFENEPWGNSKDAIERAINFLSSEEGR